MSCRFITVFALLLFGGCSRGSVTPQDGLLAIGTWGGDNAGVIVTDSTAHVHIGCTFGDVPGRIALNASGRFSVRGSYVLRAYPVFIGPALPAEFKGQVRGRTLELEVVVTDTVANQIVTLGPVTTTFDREPTMGPCPICDLRYPVSGSLYPFRT